MPDTEHIKRLIELTHQITEEERDIIQKLRMYETGLKLFFLLSSDLICIAEKDRFTVVNPSWHRVLGWTVEELTTRPWVSFIHPDDVEKTITTATIQESANVTEFENRYRCKDGTYVTLSWSATQWLDGLTYAIARVVVPK